MQRTGARTVELTDAEELAKEWFDSLLDNGNGIPVSAKLALNRLAVHKVFGGTPISREFVRWLSDDTVELYGSRYRIKMESRNLEGTAQ